MNVGVGPLGGTGSAQVTLAPPGRAWASASLSLASGASGNVSLFGSAAGIRLLRLSTNKRSRVRLYGDQSARTADLARALGQEPSGDHGVLLDYAMTAKASGGIGKMAPTVDAHNLDNPPANVHYVNLVNFDAEGTVVVAFEYLPTEVV
jgi:hypothetical protein